MSGNGRECGEYALEDYTEIKTVSSSVENRSHFQNQSLVVRNLSINRLLYSSCHSEHFGILYVRFGPEFMTL